MCSLLSLLLVMMLVLSACSNPEETGTTGTDAPSGTESTVDISDSTSEESTTPDDTDTSEESRDDGGETESGTGSSSDDNVGGVDSSWDVSGDITESSETTTTSSEEDDNNESSETESQPSTDNNDPTPLPPGTHTVTFKQSGYSDIVKTVANGGTLTDVPTPNTVKGHTTVWSVTNFTNITGNITVNAVSTPNTYRITFESDGVQVSYVDVVYGNNFEFPNVAKDSQEYILVKWIDKDTGETVTAGKYQFDNNKTFVAVWDRLWSDGY